jgi:hypothetical protein
MDANLSVKYNTSICRTENVTLKKEAVICFETFAYMYKTMARQIPEWCNVNITLCGVDISMLKNLLYVNINTVCCFLRIWKMRCY